MPKNAHYILSPLFYLSVALAGRFFTRTGVTEWYPLLEKPSWTPPGSVIGLMWTVIYVLACLSLIIFVNNARGKPLFRTVILVYAVNGIINGAWSYVFFTKHLLGPAVVNAALIGITTLLIMVLSARSSAVSAVLLAPYLIWVSFATVLSYEIYRMN